MKMSNRVGEVRWFAIVVIVAAMLVLATAVFAASVGIDTFDDGTQVVSADPVTNQNAGYASSGATLGTERDVQVTWVYGTGVTNVRINNFGSNSLSFAAEASVKGTALIQWDGVDGNMTLVPGGLGGVDFTSGGTNDSILLRLVVNDVPAAITFRVYSGSASAYYEATYNTSGGIETGESVDVAIPFSSFTPVGGGANWASVGAFEMFIDATLTEGTDLTVDFVETNGDRDYGDLPDGYPVTFLENGARHVALGPILGSNRDIELDGVHSANALHDDQYVGPVVGAPDDEDGVAATGIWNATNGGTLRVTVTNCPGTCYLNGWVDFTQDSDFADAGEHILTDQAISNGANQIVTFPLPQTVTGLVNARFRICSSQGMCNTVVGEAENGEVEDYQWEFSPLAVTLNRLQAAQLSPVEQVLALARSWLQ